MHHTTSSNVHLILSSAVNSLSRLILWYDDEKLMLVTWINHISCMLNRGMVCWEPHQIQQGKMSSLAPGAHKLPVLIRIREGSSPEMDVGGLAKNEPAVYLCSKEGWHHTGCSKRRIARQLKEINYCSFFSSPLDQIWSTMPIWDPLM